MYVKTSLFDFQENVMNETVCSENVEKSDLKLVVEAKVSQHLECFFAEEVQMKKNYILIYSSNYIKKTQMSMKCLCTIYF